MKRSSIPVLLTLALLFNSSGLPINASTVRKDLPDPNQYQVEDFELTGLSLFSGSGYVDNSWIKVRLAIPKQVKCVALSETVNYSFGNCYVIFWASAESSVSLNADSPLMQPDYDVVIDRTDGRPNEFGEFTRTYVENFNGFAYIEKMKPVGSGWREFSVRFFKKESGPVFVKLGVNANINPEKVLKKAVPIQLIVKSEAEVDAEKKAAADRIARDKAAAEKAAAEKAAEEVRVAEEERLAEEARVAQELAEWKNKKLSISCVKGKVTKKVIGDPPVCPAGYTNQRANLLTFQAYSKCKLYKQDAAVGGAQIQDSGRTLALHLVPNVEFLLTGLTKEHFNCATKTLKVPGFVGSKISATRAIDGIQSAKWGKITAFWNYHPEDGLKITFNTK
jgi:hypothetical protein